MSDPLTDEDLAQIVQWGCFAADDVALHSANRELTPAEMTRREIKAALDLLIGNGIIAVTDPGTWPEYIKLDPPYDRPTDKDT